MKSLSDEFEHGQSPRLTKAVIFDCDGVLIDSEVIASECLANLLSKRGVQMDSAQVITKFVGMSGRQMRAFLESTTNDRLPDEFEKTLWDATRVAFQHALRPIRGAREMLVELRARNVDTSVASNSGHDRLRYSLELADLWSLLAPNIFSASSFARDKPAPDIFLYAANRMKMEPDFCLVVDDSISGIQAAGAAGIPAIGFCGGSHCKADHRDALLRAGACATIDDLSQLQMYV